MADVGRRSPKRGALLIVEVDDRRELGRGGRVGTVGPIASLARPLGRLLGVVGRTSRAVQWCPAIEQRRQRFDRIVTTGKVNQLGERSVRH